MSKIEGLKRALEIANQVKLELGNSLDIALVIQALEREINAEIELFEAYIEKENE